MRRSVLFTPGTRPERIQKALETGAADIVVADLEDAVAPQDKIEARIAVRNALLAVPESTAERAVRINAWPSRLAEEDLEVVLHAAPELILVPKAESVDDILALDARLDGHECGLLLILETAAGVLAARDLAGCCDRVRAIAFGAEDLAADAGLRRSASNAEVAVPRALVALAAAAEEKDAIDMITADLDDADRLGREAFEASSLGYAGKMCIHPKQVAVVHAAFAPTPEEVAWAKRVVAAAEAGDVGAGGIIVVDGRMIDVPLVAQAHRIVDLTAKE